VSSRAYLRLAVTLLGSCFMVAAAVATPAAAPLSVPLDVRQDPFVRHLLMPGDRVAISYVVDTPGITSPAGWLYVRNNLQKSYQRLPLKLKTVTGTGGKQPQLRADVPASLVRGETLLYYVEIRDPSSGRSATAPAAGAKVPERAWILEHPTAVDLGAHTFGRTRRPEAVVARAGPADVKFQTEGDPLGPQTFVVGSDRSIWLLDGLNQRLLVWRPGRPAAPSRSVPLPFFSPDTDFALGPGGTVYDARWDAAAQKLRLDRLSSTGKLLWESTLAAEISNSPLRVGPDGALDAVAGLPGSLGSERGWTPLTTRDGRPLSVAEQKRRDGWPFQPAPRGLRLLSVTQSPREMRFALIDRANHVVRSWRVTSRTRIGPGYNVPALVGGDPVVVLDATAGSGEQGTFQWEYEVLRLEPGGAGRYSLARTVWGDNLLADVRVGPDGKLYRLGSSPDTGITVSRFSLGR
jgi:hypothetical protein